MLYINLVLLVMFMSMNNVCRCFRTNIPIGLLVDPRDRIAATIVRHTLWLQSTEASWPKEYVMEVLEETFTPGDASEIDRAVCRLMKQGIYALVAPTDPLSYQILASYSNDFELPLISPSFPELPPDIRPMYAVSIQPSSSRAVVDLLRHLNWQDFVYLYDADDGPETLQMIFQLGYRLLNFRLTGILRTSHPEEANRYLRKLCLTKKHRSFNVILDMDPALARDIIIRHVHDAHVGKTNFHFLIKKPALEEFWTNNSAEFGGTNVTGFLALTSSNVRKFEDLWNSLPPEKWKGAGTKLNISSYFYRDASLTLAEALKKLLKRGLIPHSIEDSDAHKEALNCLENHPQPLKYGRLLAAYIKQGIVADGVSGRITFDPRTNQRQFFEIKVIQSTRKGYQMVGTWKDTEAYRPTAYPGSNQPKALARIGEGRKYKVASVLSPPFLMEKENINKTAQTPTDKYEGFCVDLLELLAKELKFDYELLVFEANDYGKYVDSVGEWTGTVGALIKGKTDMVVADLPITGLRQRVVDFADPFAAVSLSILMKNPQSVSTGSSSFFFLSAFSSDIWICIVVSAAVVTALFYAMSKFTGSPDNIEAASRVWGKKFTIVSSTWFTTGSALMQGTGIYPRSTSCRVLGSTWWCFTLVVFVLYIASLTSQLYMESMPQKENPQLSRLHSLSLESIINEGVENNWPRIGLFDDSSARKYIQGSTIPVYKQYAKYLTNNPDVVTNSVLEGVDRVRKSNGDYAFLVESLVSDYYSSQAPCDLVSIHDSVAFATYGIAVPLWSPLKFEINEALRVITQKGDLGNLHREWFIERSRCKGDKPTNIKNSLHVDLLTISGLFYVLLVGLALVAIVGAGQYYVRMKKKEERRTKLSFEEVSMGNTLPLPPPELLLESPPEEDSGVIDGWAERRLVPPSSFRGEDNRRTSNSREEE